MPAKFYISIKAYAESETGSKERTFDKEITITSGEVGPDIRQAIIGVLDSMENELRMAFVG